MTCRSFEHYVKKSQLIITSHNDHSIFLLIIVVSVSLLQIFALINGGVSFWGYEVFANGSNLEGLTCSTISLMMCSFALCVASLPYDLMCEVLWAEETGKLGKYVLFNLFLIKFI